MAEATTAQVAGAQPPVEAGATAAPTTTTAPTAEKPVEAAATAEAASSTEHPDAEKPAPVTGLSSATTDKPAEKPDVEMEDVSQAPVADSETKPEPVEGEGKAETEQPAESAAKPQQEVEGAAAVAAPPAEEKGKVARRKSTGPAEHKGKKLNKKQSKAKILHLDAKPGDHFFAKLKGFPPWPVIVCTESMLPQTMLSTRPVSAARTDGSYREDFADGGKKAAERTYPVMYLHTNEFSWTRNTDLEELDHSTVKDLVVPKMRKDLQQAHILAAESNSIEHYQALLEDFEQAKQELAEAQAAEAEEKAAKAEEKLAKQQAKAEKAKATKKKNRKSEAAVGDEDDDAEMLDVGDDEESETKKKSKKRKAEDEDATTTPARSDSVKKPKIKLTVSSTPKSGSNGTQSPMPAKDSAKPAKAKTAKKPTKDADAKEDKEQAPREQELTAEERQDRKQKEILFLRHRLQKGLLNKEQPIKEDEMKSMSEFLAKLETFPDLEVAIIKATKINKVLKAILKVTTIPKEEEYSFKPRSQSLLGKWTKLLDASEDGADGKNGVNGGTPTDSAPTKEANGIKENGLADESQEETKEPVVEKQEAPKQAAADAPKMEEPKAESKAESKAEATEKPAAEKTEAPAAPATAAEPTA